MVHLMKVPNTYIRDSILGSGVKVNSPSFLDQTGSLAYTKSWVRLYDIENCLVPDISD